MCPDAEEKKNCVCRWVHLAGAPLNPSRSHIESKVVAVTLEDPKMLCFERGLIHVKFF